ncbi:glycyl-radical enzyme activating protein [Candidatus Bipolaricaulota bacterium]|nr:glycyl-radical enzyme activating protein [Candidatus Bipolaricaulota bacterium]
MKGIIFDVKKYAIHDGPGIRTTVFFKGCPLNCIWCHNPESINPEPEPSLGYRSPFQLNQLAEGDHEVIGEEVTADAVMDQVLKDRIYYDESGGGVTFSGGEPLTQPDFLVSLLEMCKGERISTVVDTSGMAGKETVERASDLVDLFLFDIKLIDGGQHKRYTGVGNERIIDNLDFLLKRNRQVELRFPLIPGITDGSDNIKGIREFIRERPGVKRMSILPYHDVEKKYTKLGLDFDLGGLKPPREKEIEGIASEFEKTGITVEVGG